MLAKLEDEGLDGEGLVYGCLILSALGIVSAAICVCISIIALVQLGDLYLKALAGGQ